MSGAGNNNLLQIAQVLKSDGTDGGLMIGLHDIGTEDINPVEPVFIFFDELPVPFFIEAIDRKSPVRAIVHLTGIRTLKDAEEITGKGIYIHIAESEKSEPSEDLSDLIGWTMEDGDNHMIGKVSSFEDFPGNPCLEINTKNGQKLIPIHEDLILSADPETKVIAVRIPEGLI